MHQPPMKQTVKQLYLAGNSIREICRILHLSRNTVRAIIRANESVAKQSSEQESMLLELIPALLQPCKGNLVRIREVLAAEYQQDIAYSTLTRLVRECQLRETPSKRFGEYVYEPGLEMQHDTSPHYLEIDGKKIKAQCASLVFGFSRMLFMQYYPCFTRFEAKVFLNEALKFMRGSCQRCVIDNTSVILAAGAGKHAVVAPEMVFFSRMFGFEFIAHAVRDCNRKGKIERPFYYIETNFLAGRTFNDWQDLNQQARRWCDTVSNCKPKRSLGMSPEAAYIQEKPHTLALPNVMPPIYNHAQRTVDTEGYISFDTNRYSVPESLIGYMMEIYQYIDKIEIFYNHRSVATHVRLMGKRYQRVRIKAHHPSLCRANIRQAVNEAERQLSGIHSTLDLYLQQLKSHVRGRGNLAFKQLLHLKQLYPEAPFLKAIESAHCYGLYDMKRLETIILRLINTDFFNL